MNPSIKLLLLPSLIVTAACSNGFDSTAPLASGATGGDSFLAGSGGSAPGSGTLGDLLAAGGTPLGPGGAAATGGSSAASGGQGSIAPPVVPCSEDDSTWTSTDIFAKHSLPPLTVRNNVWGGDRTGFVAGQSVWAVSATCWGVHAAHTNGTGLVKSYPNTMHGWSLYDGILDATGQLPAAVDELKSAQIYWKMETPNDGRHMALWDIYFHPNQAPGKDQKAHTNLQIFQRILDGDGYFRAEAEKGEKLTLGGVNFSMNLIDGDSLAATNRVITLYMGPYDVSPMGAAEQQLDLKGILDDLLAKGTLATQLYLTGLQNGWEIIVGGDFKTTSYASWIETED